jgi:hypothetical protein
MCVELPKLNSQSSRDPQKRALGYGVVQDKGRSVAHQGFLVMREGRKVICCISACHLFF